MTASSDSSRPRRAWAHYLAAGIVTLAVVLPRSVSIQRAHSESWDDNYHLARGMNYWVKDPTFKEYYNDPPLGEGLIAVPMLLAGATLDGPLNHPGVRPEVGQSRYAVLYGQPLPPETLMQLVAAWKALLFVPGALLVFHFCRRLYGLASSWLALGMLLADPTVAAHTPVAALDVLAMFAIATTAYAQWRWSQHPTVGRLLAASLATAAGMLIKHTAIILPLVGVAFVALNQLLRSDQRPRRALIRPALNQVGAAALLTVLFIWALTLFDVSRPKDHCRVFSGTYSEQWGFISDVVNPNLDRQWPAGIYLASLLEGVGHALHEPGSWVLGRYHPDGVWYYHPVLASYKVPVGIGAVLLLGAVSLLVRRPRWEELALLVPLALYTLLLLRMSVQLGFRHSLPAYLLAMMLASRCAAGTGWGWKIIAWAGVLAAGAHSALWHPDYLSYVNWPREKVWLRIGDSNLDWGQGLKQARGWIDTHAPGRDDIYLMYDGAPSGVSIPYYLGDRVKELPGHVPETGLLIVSPVFVSGSADPAGMFSFLRDREPDAVIGDCLLVYEMGQ